MSCRLFAAFAQFLSSHHVTENESTAARDRSSFVWMSPVTVRRARLGPSGSGSGEGEGDGEGSGDGEGLSGGDGEVVEGLVDPSAELGDAALGSGDERPAHALITTSRTTATRVAERLSTA